MMGSMESIAAKVLSPLLAPWVFSQRIYWLYLASAFLAAVFLLMKSRNFRPFTLKELLAYCFPKEIYTHRSALNDYFYFYFNWVFLGIFFFSFMGLIQPSVSEGVQGVLEVMGMAGQLGQSTVFVAILYTLTLALMFDLGGFIVHYLQHKISWLWEFHKVHHTAEVLTPMTVYRMHPVDIVLTVGLSGILMGVADGVFHALYTGQVGVLNIGGINIILFLFYLCLYNLRHSHIWVDYGPFWSRILISPAQHQIHHSKEPRHWDKNMGFIFAFWDAWTGTLYVPKEKETFALGIGDEEEQQRFNSIWAFFIHPFARIFHALKPQDPFHLKRVAVVILVILFLMPGVLFEYATRSQVVTELPETVFLEELTWTEVRDKLANGYTTVIIPTGGTEQNGPHMVLGKHNYVIRRNAGVIAERIGHTLVAPVLPYVPEGRIHPPENHMKFAGTLSISEETFESILEASARSLKAHGFKTICLVGDSGGNQAGQKRVAEKLNTLWKSEGVTVLHVGNYYFENGQTRWLKAQGERLESIGQHAGIRDTSEMMAIYPQGIRPAAIKRDNRFEVDGVDGDPHKASAAYGKFLLELKVKAAVRQIRGHLKEKSVKTATN